MEAGQENLWFFNSVPRFAFSRRIVRKEQIVRVQRGVFCELIKDCLECRGDIGFGLLFQGMKGSHQNTSRLGSRIGLRAEADFAGNDRRCPSGKLA